MEEISMLGDSVLIESEEDDSETSGGIVLPDSAKKKPTKGKVISVGPGAFDPNSGKRIPMSVADGQVVFFRKWAGSEVTLGGKDYVVLKESDIIGIFK